MDRKIAERLVKQKQAVIDAALNDTNGAMMDIQMSSLPQSVKNIASGELLAVTLILKNVRDVTLPSWLTT